MRIVRISLEGFRKFKHRLTLEFTDSLGRPLDLVLLTGTNGSGKTTVMDAISLSLQPSFGLPCVRPDLPLSPRDIVSSGSLGLSAEVVLDLEFSKAEVDMTCHLLDLTKKQWIRPTERELRITWSYPDDRSRSGIGYTSYEPESGRALLQARKLLTSLIALGVQVPNGFESSAGVFFFDQQRTSLRTAIPPEIARIIRPAEVSPEAFTTNDTYDLLANVVVRSKLGSTVRLQQLELIRRHFRRLWPNIEIDGRDDGDDFMLTFAEGTSEYRYQGLSCGQQAALGFIVQWVEKRISSSVVMIDEIELHLEEVAQRKLLNALQCLGADNQLILSTHSSYLAAILPNESKIDVEHLVDAECGHEELSNA